MHHHISGLAICLSLATLCFIACALGMITPFWHLAVVVGTILVISLASGLFYATLHLQKVR